MATQTGKKRGRPRKPIVIVRLADVQPEWEARLKRAGNPPELRSNFISDQSLPWTDRDFSGRKIRPTKVQLGESPDHQSATMSPEALYAPFLADDEGNALPTAWQRYLEYMDVVAEELSPKDKGAKLKRLALEDARSRRNARPPEFPAELGTPAEFKERLADHEMEIRCTVNRREQVIRIVVYPIPPDEDEDLDPSGEAAGRFEGLRWIPDPN